MLVVIPPIEIGDVRNQQKPGSLTYSEVGCCQGICGMTILTDDGGGVSPLTVVVTPATYAGQFADSGREDHLDSSRMVACCRQKYGTKQDKREGEQRNFGYSLSHWK